jgi:hypothetical protein
MLVREPDEYKPHRIAQVCPIRQGYREDASCGFDLQLFEEATAQIHGVAAHVQVLL